MNCSKHPNYKGYHKPKRNCPECLALWRQIQRELWKYGKKYQSITTPGFKCTIEHLFAEISCVMLYGKLPKFFWRKGNATPEIQKQYKQALLYMQRIKKYKNLFSSLEIVLNAIYVKPFKKQVNALINQIITTPVDKQSEINIDNVISNAELDEEFQQPIIQKDTKQALHQLFKSGDKNEEKS